MSPRDERAGRERAGRRTAARLADVHDAEQLFTAERPRLVGLAYRILGSRTDAEDVVQEAWIRYQRTDPDTIDRPEAWLTTVVSRLALDQLKSAHHRRATYVGPWLPEPVLTPDDPSATNDDPAEMAVMADTLTFGFLQVLEVLAPVERVVFLLADVFKLPHDQIATVVDRAPSATRQVASRARRKVRDAEPVTPNLDPEASRVVEALVAALLAGDVATVVRLVAEDAVLVSDGGGEAHAARRPIVGRDRIARFALNLSRRISEFDEVGVDFQVARINAEPGLVMRVGGELFLAATFSVDDDEVRRIHVVRNPEKLAAIELDGDLL